MLTAEGLTAEELTAEEQRNARRGLLRKGWLFIGMAAVILVGVAIAIVTFGSDLGSVVERARNVAGARGELPVWVILLAGGTVGGFFGWVGIGCLRDARAFNGK